MEQSPTSSDDGFWKALGPLPKSRPYTPLFRIAAPEMSRRDLAEYLEMEVFEDEQGALLESNPSYSEFADAVLKEDTQAMKDAWEKVEQSSHVDCLVKTLQLAMQHEKHAGCIGVVVIAEGYRCLARLKSQIYMRVGNACLLNFGCGFPIRFLHQLFSFSAHTRWTSLSESETRFYQASRTQCWRNFGLFLRFFDDALAHLITKDITRAALMDVLFDQHTLRELQTSAERKFDASQPEIAALFEDLKIQLSHRLMDHLVTDNQRKKQVIGIKKPKMPWTHMAPISTRCAVNAASFGQMKPNAQVATVITKAVEVGVIVATQTTTLSGPEEPEKQKKKRGRPCKQKISDFR